tara:strand:+ start:249 stop:1106 length:858 start_codon:yes stop_codon:yes gene_type:complete
MSLKKHIAGIVPVSGLKTDFNMPWHESLMPLGPNYLAVERAVAECAYAGCDSIWIVCDDSVSPLIRYQIGEKLQDPVYNYRHYEFDKNAVKKPIRVYYVPLAIKDINKRDNLAWSAIFGAQTANNVLGSLSNHLKPDKFFIAWPYGYCDPWIMREHRKTLLENQVVFTYNGENVKNNKYLPFTFNSQQMDKLVEESITTSSGLWVRDGEEKERLPVEERYSYRDYDLKKVFNGLDFSSYTIIEIEKYATIDCWSSYCEFISNNPEIRKPKLLKYSEWNEIGVDHE